MNLRPTIANVGELHRRRMESERARVAPAVTTPAATPRADTVESVTAEREAVQLEIAALVAARAACGKKDPRRAQYGAQVQALHKRSADAKARLRALKIADPRHATDVAPTVKIIRALLDIIDRYEDAGLAHSDAEVAELNAAANWLELNGGGER